MSFKSQLNTRPHPGPWTDIPIPNRDQERENYSPSYEMSCHWICRMVVREEQSARWLFPLPGGEGQGEGGLGFYLHFLNS
jgi:hypothetical protein